MAFASFFSSLSYVLDLLSFKLLQRIGNTFGKKRITGQRAAPESVAMQLDIYAPVSNPVKDKMTHNGIKIA